MLKFVTGNTNPHEGVNLESLTGPDGVSLCFGTTFLLMCMEFNQ